MFTKLNTMRKIACLLAFCLATAVALPQQQRIIGGSVTNIGLYPYAAALLTARNAVNFRQSCGGTIINNRSVLTAAHCMCTFNVNQIRSRVGSTNGNSGGSVHQSARIINHPNYNTRNLDNDIGILRITNAFSFGGNVRVGSIAGANFNVPDNQLVWAIGWGLTSPGGSQSEQLRHVQLRTFNQNTCQNLYGSTSSITANMMCAGWQSGGRAVCSADSGGPLLLNNVVVGVTSFGFCGVRSMPDVYVRVSRFTSWIQGNS